MKEISLTPEDERRRDLRFSVRHADFSDVELPEIPSVPGMISAAEQRYLYWLVGKTFTGKGAIVEVGTWLGRSTLAMAAGLKSRNLNTTLHCYDKYNWIDAYNQPRLKAHLDLKEGDDFQPYFKANTLSYYPHIRSTKTTVRDLTWSNGPIEILFLDAPKSRQDITKCLMVLAPALIPNFSIVVLQDYLYAPAYAIATVVAANAQRLKLVHTVTDSSSAAFAVTDAFSSDETGREWDFTKWTADEVLSAWEYILAALPPQPRSFLGPGLAMLLLDRSDHDRACELIKRVKFTSEGIKRWQFLSRNPWLRKTYQRLFEVTDTL